MICIGFRRFTYKFQRLYLSDDGLMFFKSFDENIKVIDKISLEYDHLQSLTTEIYCYQDLDCNTLVLI